MKTIAVFRISSDFCNSRSHDEDYGSSDHTKYKPHTHKMYTQKQTATQKLPRGVSDVKYMIKKNP